MWKEAIVAYFEAMSRDVHGGIEEIYKKLYDNRYPNLDSNQSPSEWHLLY
jgi:hypothetical protein